MKTLVELFDSEPIENILAIRVFRPENAVFVCDKKLTPRKKRVIQNMLTSWEMRTKLFFYPADTASLADITQTLQKITRDFDDCVFDFNGGKDLVLCAAGIFCEKNNIPGFFIDMPSIKFYNVFGCEELREKFILPRFRVKDILASAGAKIEGYGRYRPDKRDFETCDDIMRVWDIVWSDISAWAEQVNWFQQTLKNTAAKDGEAYLSVKVPAETQSNGNRTRANASILHRLNAAGIITRLDIGKDEISLTFKNAALKNCLMSHGIWLELYGFLTAYRLNWFNDVKTSVIIGWSDRDKAPTETRNEIDLLMVKGITPVFVSCKMGMPNALALNEIKLLSLRFGGELAKAVVLTAANVKEGNPVLYNRAKELDISLIDFCDIRDNLVAERLKKIALGEGENN